MFRAGPFICPLRQSDFDLCHIHIPELPYVYHGGPSVSRPGGRSGSWRISLSWVRGWAGRSWPTSWRTRSGRKTGSRSSPRTPTIISCRRTPGSRSAGASARTSASTLPRRCRRRVSTSGPSRRRRCIRRKTGWRWSTGHRSTTITSSSRRGRNSPSTRSRGLDRMAAIRSRSAMSITPRRRARRSRRSAGIPARSSLARSRAPPASARPMNSR